MADIGATNGDHVAHGFVAGNKWEIGLHRPGALGGMQIGVTDPAGFNLDQHVVCAGTWHVDFLNGSGLPNACTTAAFIVLSIDDLLWNGSSSFATGNCGCTFPPMNHSRSHALCVKRQAKAARRVGKRWQATTTAKEGDLAGLEPQHQGTPKYRRAELAFAEFLDAWWRTCGIVKRPLSARGKEMIAVGRAKLLG